MGGENLNTPWVRPCPFSKYSVDPEHIEVMREAFRRVCDILQLECGRADPRTDQIVMKIVELAKAGELDPERLCIDVLAEFEVPSERLGSVGETSRGPPVTTAVSAEDPN
jgi:hypothetical protein